MKTFDSIPELLDLAIKEEEEAAAFYSALAEKMDRPWMKQAFEDFAREEQGHKARLEAVKRGEYAFGSEAKQIQDLGLADYLVAEEPTPDMNYAEALILAMKKEKAAYRLYLDLATIAEAEELTELFLALAAEEAKHKLRFEIEYDDHILKED